MKKESENVKKLRESLEYARKHFSIAPPPEGAELYEKHEGPQVDLSKPLNREFSKKLFEMIVSS